MADGKITVVMKWEHMYVNGKTAESNEKICAKLSGIDKVKYAVFAAEQAVGFLREDSAYPFYEHSIEIVKKYIANPTQENANAVYYRSHRIQHRIDFDDRLACHYDKSNYGVDMFGAIALATHAAICHYDGVCKPADWYIIDTVESVHRHLFRTGGRGKSTDEISDCSNFLNNILEYGFNLIKNQ